MYRYSRFSSFASRVARTLGHPATFMIFLGAALLWLATGPLFHFSGNWYSAYGNTATIVTTLLLFLIQHTQSREIASIQFKLNEIIRVSEGAHNALLDIEEMTDRDYDRIKASYTMLARQAREQLQSGKLKWATARVSMESLDSFLDPGALNEDEEPEEPSGSSAPASGQLASALERMARVAAHSGHAPMALIMVNDRDHNWLRSETGFVAAANEADEQDRTLLVRALIAQVAASRQPVVVSDTRRRPLGANAGAPVGAFIAIPLIGARHKVVGCLAVLDTVARQWHETEIAALQDLAALTVEQIAEQARHHPVRVYSETSSDIVVTEVAGSNSSLTPDTPPDSARAPQQEKGTDMETSNSMNGADVAAALRTILVVDDSATNRTLLQRRLEREGYRVLMAGNGHEALDQVQSEPVGLILLDVMMPEMDGEEVLQRMHADDRLRHIPVIMVTALDEQASVQRCLQAGAKDYLLKPFDPVQLRARVHAYLPPPATPEPATRPEVENQDAKT